MTSKLTSKQRDEWVENLKKYGFEEAVRRRDAKDVIPVPDLKEIKK